MMYGVIPSRTQRGLKYVSWCLSLYVVAMLLLLFTGLVMVLTGASLDAILPGDTPPDPQVLQSVLGPLAAIVGLLCGFIVVAFAAIVLFFMGFYNAYIGRDEYGEERVRDMTAVLVLLVVYIVLLFTSYAVSSAVAPSSTVSDARGMWMATLVGLPFSVASTVVFGLMFLYMIRSLATPLLVNVVWAGIAVNLISVGLGFYVEVAAITMVSGQPGGAPGAVFGGILGPTFVAGGISFLGGLLFLMAFLETRKRLNEGEVEMTAAPMYGYGRAAYARPPVAQREFRRIDRGPSSAVPAGPPAEVPDGRWLYCPRCGTPEEGYESCPSCGLPNTGGASPAGGEADGPAAEEE